MHQPEKTPLDLSMESLRAQQPEQYRRWVVVGVYCALAGYFVSAIATLFQFGFAEVLRTTDPYVLLIHVGSALILFKRNRPVTAAAVTLAGTWLDIHIVLLLTGLYSPSTRCRGVGRGKKFTEG